MQRWAQKFGLPINVTPKYWPTPMALACQVIMAGGTVGVDQGDISLAVLSAVWVHDLNIADPDDMAQGLKVAGLPAEPLLRAAATADVISAAQIETAKGIDIGIFGSPTYVVDGEWFFGQDRLAFLQDRLNLR